MQIKSRWRVVALVALPLILAGCVDQPAPPATTVPAQGSTAATPTMEATAAPKPTPTPTPTAPGNPGLDQAQLDAQLREAAWANDVEAAGRLIAWGANVNAKDGTMQSPYLIATSEGYVEFLRLTLAHGANVKDLDSWNGTGLIRAAERGHWEVIGELIQAGVPLDHVNRVGYQAIHEAVWFGRDDASYHATVRVLVAGGVQFNVPSVNEGLTPAQMAASKGFPEQSAVLAALTQAPLPADPAAALLAAAKSGDANAAALALRAGAKPGLQDSDGKTPLEIAEAAGNVEVAQVVRALCTACR